MNMDEVWPRNKLHSL